MQSDLKKSLIIFDLDGTLIDSAPDLANAIDKMLTHYGKAGAGIKNVQNWVGNGSLKLVERALDWAKIPKDKQDQAHDIFLAQYANCHDGTIAYDGVNDGLNRLLDKGFMLAICTNKPAQFLPKILHDMGWLDKFSCVIGGDSLPTKKPDPMPLFHICKELNTDTNQAIMVGDSLNDVLAGRNANMTTLAVSYGYNHGKPINDSQPDGVFDNFLDLVQFIINNH